MSKTFLQFFIEIIAIIIILAGFIYLLTAMGAIASYDEIKYKNFVRFLEEKIIKRETDIFDDYVPYNPLKYSILFNFSSKRIELIKCDTYDNIAIFHRINGDFVRNFSTGCSVIYRTKEITDFDLWSVSLIVLKEDIYVYTLSKYTNTRIDRDAMTAVVQECAGINISKPKPTEIRIDQFTKIKDTSSIFLGPKKIVYDGYCIANCDDYCKIDYEKLIKENLISFLTFTATVDPSAKQIKIFIR